jgi:hypothetical protein
MRVQSYLTASSSVRKAKENISEVLVLPSASLLY